MHKIVKDIDYLRQISTPVSVEEAKNLTKELEEALKFTPNALGIAAIQINHPKTIGIVKLNDNSNFMLINPEFIEGDDEFVSHRESCLSFPSIAKSVKRYGQILIKNNRVEDDKFIEEKIAFTESDRIATITIQHEMDHFKGIILPDKEVAKGITLKRESAKIGRNDKCPCGSGIKYKKCCGR